MRIGCTFVGYFKMLNITPQIQQRPELRLTLSPQMQQSLAILQMSSLELDQYIDEQVETNPFLDRSSPREIILSEALDNFTPPATAEDEANEAAYENAVQAKVDENISQIHQDSADSFRDYSDFSRNPDLEARYQYYQDSITREESLSAYLLRQLSLTCSDPQQLAIGERIIIGDINPDGMFTGSVQEIAEELKTTPAAVSAVLEIIKKFEPTGIGAATLIECLTMQIEAEYPKEPELITMLTEHWDKLLNRKFSPIAEAMGISEERVKELNRLLATLNPFPGREYSQEQPVYIYPEITVEKIGDDFIAMLTADNLSGLSIDEAYIRDIRSKKQSQDDKRYVDAHVDAAQLLLRNIERREDTIKKVAQAIVDEQKAFMEKGPSSMKPLTLEQIAVKVDVHESTVSRAISGKYMQTPQGVFEMKYFFSSALSAAGGEELSSTAVCEQIKKIIEEEDKKRPLSDQKITDKLNELGVSIARRTVTKYREQLNILPARLRRDI
ncbi:MAG: RNA polymerase factor sigma-54 [Candidatus Hydrogenedens sp.]|jgi:RNA polymerase sigma-54 factor|nr:RNA polymerase factor sigma-54 [Candidatus Hydrogenedens sp.]